MATTVRDITAAAMAQCLTTLGSPYRVLRHQEKLEKNDARDADKAYAVRPLDAEPAEGLVGYETLKHYFEFVVSRSLARQDSDAEIQTVLDDMYDKCDQIFKQFVALKLSLPLVVMKVDERSINKFVLENGNVFLVNRFYVLYRQALY